MPANSNKEPAKNKLVSWFSNFVSWQGATNAHSLSSVIEERRRQGAKEQTKWVSYFLPAPKEKERTMKFFLDTANFDEIKQINAMGLLDGVTTNPSLVAKTGKNFHDAVADICKTVAGPVNLEVVATAADAMVEEAHELVKYGDNVVVKIPMTKPGLQAVKQLASENIATNVTLCFSSLQALLAAKAGARYISPFVGRLDDCVHDGMELVSQIKTIYANYHFDTEIIVASIRHPLHILNAALIGADIATVPFAVFNKICKHPLTDIGVQTFWQDWQKVPK